MHLKIIYDKSVFGATRAGVYVFAMNVLNSLKKDLAVDVVEFNNPFSTVGKVGLFRKINSLLRLLYIEVVVFFYKPKSVFFFPAPEMSFLVSLLKLDYIITIHDLFAWKNNDKTTFFASLKQRLLPFYARRAKLIVTVSEYSKNEISECFNVDLSKIVVCHNGLDKRYINDSCAGHYSNLEVNVSKPFILFVGSSEPRKNLTFLIDVFDELNSIRAKRKDNLINLVMTCAETWGSPLESRISVSPYKSQIIITGHVDEEHKIGLYKSASATVLPSLAEGFGIPVIESLSLGTPILVNNNTALSMFSLYGATVLDNFDSACWARILDNIIANNLRVESCLVNSIALKFRWSESARVIVERLKCQ